MLLDVHMALNYFKTEDFICRVKEKNFYGWNNVIHRFQICTEIGEALVCVGVRGYVILLHFFPKTLKVRFVLKTLFFDQRMERCKYILSKFYLFF